MVQKMRVGSRKSELALIQTNHVIAQLKKINPDIEFEVVPISTVGDKVLDVALSKIGEKSLFTKELEIALHNNDVDFVVHSLKDLPTLLPDKMVIGSILEREDPRDAVIMKKGSEFTKLEQLPEGAIIGTSSLRRAAQLKAAYPSLVFRDVRGNLNTRLRKLDNSEGQNYAALVLAVAGVSRMGWSERISELLAPNQCMYAVGQGALGVECRQDDNNTLSLLAQLHHKETLLRAIAERGFLRTLEGGCSVPVAVNSSVQDGKMILTGGVWSLCGKQSLVQTHQLQMEGSVVAAGDMLNDNNKSYVGIVAANIDATELIVAEAVGVQLAEQLLAQGAKDILAAAKAENDKK